jgi:hypothetical protein
MSVPNKAVESVGNQEDKTFNEKVASWVSSFTGNMKFFWASLAFILVLRVSHPPSKGEFLLNLENDFQFLLLAANAVVNAKQLRLLLEVLGEIKRKTENLEEKTREIEAQVHNQGNG